MPKRSCESDIDHISKKLRKLQMKLKRAKQKRSSSRSREDSVHVERNYEAPPNLPEDDDVNSQIVSDIPSLAPLQHLPTQTVISLVSQDEAEQDQPRPASPPPSAAEPCQDTIGGDATATVDDDLIEILGEDPTQTAKFGKDLHVGLANRLEHILVNGLENDARKEITKKFLTPANCARITPPILNPEIKAAMSEINLKRDKGIENRQRQLGIAITCISEVITTHMQEKNRNTTLLKQLMDAVKIMCDSLHSDSIMRRYFALSSLKKNVNDHLMQTKIDKYLFGEGLAETLKTAKAVTKSSAEIKFPRTYDKNVKKTQQPQPSTSRGLNWKAPPPTRGQSGPQRSRQPHPPAARTAPAPPPPASRPPPPSHSASSKTSRYQQRSNRRY